MFSIYGDALSDDEREAIDRATSYRRGHIDACQQALGILFDTNEPDTVLFDDLETQGAAEDVDYTLKEVISAFRDENEHLLVGSPMWWEELSDRIVETFTDHTTLNSYRAALIGAVAMHSKLVAYEAIHHDDAVSVLEAVPADDENPREGANH